MSSQLVIQALHVGMDSCRVKMALKRRFRQKGKNFKNLNQLIDACLDQQLEQEDRHRVENGEQQQEQQQEQASIQEPRSRDEETTDEETTTEDETPTPTVIKLLIFY